MAIQQKGYLQGQIGDLVLRKIDDKQIVQAKPSQKIRQSTRSKAASNGFGKISAAGRLIRHTFKSLHMDLNRNP